MLIICSVKQTEFRFSSSRAVAEQYISLINGQSKNGPLIDHISVLKNDIVQSKLTLLHIVMKRTCEIGSVWPRKAIKNWYVCRCWQRNKTNESRSINRRVRFKWRVVVVSGVLGRKTTSQIGSISHVNACALYTVAIRYIGETFDRLLTYIRRILFSSSYHRNIALALFFHFIIAIEVCVISLRFD